jgi:hypothetical protein
VSWPELIKLILYHLQEYYCEKSFDLDKVFLPFCEKNWNRFILPESVRLQLSFYVLIAQINHNCCHFRCKIVKKLAI